MSERRTARRAAALLLPGLTLLAALRQATRGGAKREAGPHGAPPPLAPGEPAAGGYYAAWDPASEDASAARHIEFQYAGMHHQADTALSGMWVVTGTVRRVGPASIIATLPGEIPQRSATNSVWPGWAKPIAYSCCLLTGPVTTAAALPDRARPTASSSESSEQCAPTVDG